MSEPIPTKPFAGGRMERSPILIEDVKANQFRKQLDALIGASPRKFIVIDEFALLDGQSTHIEASDA